MTHKGTRSLQTKRVLLRRFTYEDATPMFNNYANDPSVTKYLSWEPHGNIEVTKGLLKSWLKDYENKNCYNWAIVYEDELVGSISLLNPNDSLNEAEAGYCIAKKHWGKGVVAEALAKVIEFSFNEIGFQRIHAKHVVENVNSGKVMLKCGMKYIERRNAPLALKPDTIVLCDCYEILSSDWELKYKNS